jgi:hypothetical protein
LQKVKKKYDPNGFFSSIPLPWVNVRPYEDYETILQVEANK